MSWKRKTTSCVTRSAGTLRRAKLLMARRGRKAESDDHGRKKSKRFLQADGSPLSERRGTARSTATRCSWRASKTTSRFSPVNPNADEVEGLQAYSDLTSLPEFVHGVSIVTPPDVTEREVEETIELGIENIWLQPGAESPRAVSRAERAGVNIIAVGPCMLVTLGYHEMQGVLRSDRPLDVHLLHS